MLKVRVIEAKNEILLLHKGEKMVEYGNNPGTFYKMDNKEPNGSGLDIGLLDGHGGFDKFFKELDPVPFIDTVWGDHIYKTMKDEISQAKENLEEIHERAEAIGVQIMERENKFNLVFGDDSSDGEEIEVEEEYRYTEYV